MLICFKGEVSLWVQQNLVWMYCWVISSPDCIFSSVWVTSSQQGQPHHVRCAQTVVAFCHLHPSGLLLVCKLWDTNTMAVLPCTHTCLLCSDFITLQTFTLSCILTFHPPFHLKPLLFCYWLCHLSWSLQYKTLLCTFDLLFHYSKLVWDQSWFFKTCKTDW